MGAPTMRWYDEQACGSHKHHATYAAAKKNAHGARYRWHRAFHVFRCPVCRKGWLVGGVGEGVERRGKGRA